MKTVTTSARTVPIRPLIEKKKTEKKKKEKEKKDPWSQSTAVKMVGEAMCRGRHVYCWMKR